MEKARFPFLENPLGIILSTHHHHHPATIFAQSEQHCFVSPNWNAFPGQSFSTFYSMSVHISLCCHSRPFFKDSPLA
jgi:hypothetical protein